MADPANECFALRREDGSLTGEIKPRALVHRDGDLHGASHVFLAPLRGGRAELLLQKRSAQKDSFPGLYDISAAGHLDPAEDFAAAARRELAEELGVTGKEPEFLFAQRNEYHGAFHGKPFHDNEIAWVYLLVLDRPEEAFTPEACEVESVHWFSVREILRAMRENDPRFCLREAEFCRLLPYLAQKFGVPVDKL